MTDAAPLAVLEATAATALDDQGKREVIRPVLALEDLYGQVTAQGGKLPIQRPDGAIAEVVCSPDRRRRTGRTRRSRRGSRA